MSREKHNIKSILSYCIYAIAEIAATTLFTSAFWNQECGRDLQIWILCFTSRLFVVVPLHIWKIRDPTSADRVRQTLQYLNIVVVPSHFLICQLAIKDAISNSRICVREGGI